MLVALSMYRVLLIIYRRRRIEVEDVGRVEERVRAWWLWGPRPLRPLGAVSILIIGLLAMLTYVLLSGADVISPIGESIEVGMIYAILGIGLTLTNSVVKIPNFAHGEMATVGAYVMGYSVVFWKFPLPLAFVAAAAAGAGLGILQHLLVFRPLISRGAKVVQIMIASFALSILLRAIIWGWAAPNSLFAFDAVSRNPLTRIILPFTQITLYDCGVDYCKFGNLALTDTFFQLLYVTVPLVILLHLLLTRTLVGKSMRAVADNIELAQVTGINVENVRRITWLLTGALAGLGGAFLGIEFAPIWPELGWTYLLRIFAAVTLGGMVSFYGTIAGGLIVGLGEQWVTTVGGNFGLNSSWQPFVVFLLIVIVLLVRPLGLSGLKLPNFPTLHSVFRMSASRIRRGRFGSKRSQVPAEVS